MTRLKFVEYRVNKKTENCVSNVESGALKSMVIILKKKFCKEQYIYIRTTGVLSTWFCNYFFSTEPITLERWNLQP